MASDNLLSWAWLEICLFFEAIDMASAELGLAKIACFNFIFLSFLFAKINHLLYICDDLLSWIFLSAMWADNFRFSQLSCQPCQSASSKDLLSNKLGSGRSQLVFVGNDQNSQNQLGFIVKDES